MAEGTIRQIAVFDLDGTLMDGQSGALFSTYLFRRGELSLPRAAHLVSWGLRYKMHLPHREATARELVLGAILDKSPDQIDAIMRDFHREVMVPRYRPEAYREVTRMHDAGCVTLLVSATFLPIAEEAASTFGFDGVVATRMETDADGTYTGYVDADVIAGKEKLVAATTWADEHLGPGGWRIAYAYGDHYSDRALLGAADQPFAVCPDTVLKRTARKLGWPVLEWGGR